MPSRPIIPPSGTPIAKPGGPGSLRDTLSDIAYSAGRQDWVECGIVARDGTGTRQPPRVLIRLFKLTGDFNTPPAGAGSSSGTVSPSWPDEPNESWAYAPATLVEYYPATSSVGSPCNWAIPDDQGDTDTIAETATIWAPAAQFQDATIARKDDFLWCFYDNGPGCWVAFQHKQIPIAQYGLTYTVAGTGPDLNVALNTGANATFDTHAGAVGGGADVAIKQPGLYFAIAVAHATGNVDVVWAGGDVQTEVFLTLMAQVVLGGTAVDQFAGTAKGHCHCRVTGIQDTGRTINLPNIGTNMTPGQVTLVGTFQVPAATAAAPTTYHFTGDNLGSGGGTVIFIKLM